MGLHSDYYEYIFYTKNICEENLCKNYATLLRNNSLVLCCRRTLINVPFLFLKKHNTFSFLFMAKKQVMTVSEKMRESSIIYHLLNTGMHCAQKEGHPHAKIEKEGAWRMVF